MKRCFFEYEKVFFEYEKVFFKLEKWLKIAVFYGSSA